jgi:hypothetical protein
MTKSIQNRFWVLRRWNSYTPQVPLTDRGRGGGYYLSWQGRGLVIDPGFDYLENFQRCQLSIDGINAIFISHAHIDHTDQLEPLVMMKYERWDRIKDTVEKEKLDRPLDVFMSWDAMKRYSHSIDYQPRGVLNYPIQSIPRDKTIDLFPYGYLIKVQPLPVKHATSAKSSPDEPDDAVGLIFELYSDSSSSIPMIRIGITSDCEYEPAIVEHLATKLKQCDIVVAHLGSLDIAQLIELACLQVGNEVAEMCDSIDPKTVERRMLKSLLHSPDSKSIGEILRRLLTGGKIPHKTSSHLGFQGLYSIFEKVFESGTNTKLGIISEFGEELGSFRHKITQVLNQAILGDKRGDKERRILTGDIGLAVELLVEATQCAKCGKSGTAFLLQCTSCKSLFCLSCIDDVCIKHRQKAIFYDCAACYEPDFYPKSPLITL